MVDRWKYSGSDVASFYSVGVLGTNYGPAKIAVTPDERVSIPQLFKHCKVSTLVALGICEAK